MKKLLMAAFVFSACLVSASPVGSPVKAVSYRDEQSEVRDGMSIRAGYSGDFVFGRKLSSSKRDQNNQNLTGDWKRTYNGLEAVVNVNDTFDIIGRLGYASHTMTLKRDQMETRFKTKPGLAYGLGLRAALYEDDKTSIDAHVSYSQDRSIISDVDVKNPTSGSGSSRWYWPFGGSSSSSTASLSHLNVKDQKVQLADRSYAVGVTASHKMDSVTPYVGLQYVNNKISSKSKNNANIDTPTLKNRNNIGAVAGVSVLAGQRASLNLEGRLFNEQAVALSGQICF